MKLFSKILKTTDFYVVIIIAIMAFSGIPLNDPVFPDDYSFVVLDKNDHILRTYLNKDEQFILPPDSSDTVPAKLERAVLLYEDRYFYYHPGFNIISILKAMAINWQSGRIKYGASTISMQVCRMISPKKRNYSNKLLEILQTIKLEMLYTKNEILSLYLDHVPYGGNIRGYKAATWRFFAKKPESLTWAEAALLAVLPNSPGKVSLKRNRKSLVQKRNRLLKELHENGIIDKETMLLAFGEKLPRGDIALPKMAPHLSDYLKSKAGSKHIVKTTIEQKIQMDVNRIVKDHLFLLQGFGIENGCAIVVDNAGGSVIAYIGSQNFFAKENQGEVDGIRAARSSGSILKPFLYALAIDQGLILPQTLVKDIPTFYSTFSPSNADEHFRGIIRASEALKMSLNVPAARLLYGYGLYPFYGFLKTAGINTLFRKADDYGITLILGGAEVNAWDMATLYSGLARGGLFEPLHVVRGAEKKWSKRLISPGSAFLTLQILRDLKRPGAEYYWEQYRDRNPLAWKTGTSYGNRDAWAVGVNPQWTIAVWVGNFSGTSNPEISGARSAAPLLFDIFNYLSDNTQSSNDSENVAAEGQWFVEPSGDLEYVTICSETGFIATENCPDVEQTLAPALARKLKSCPFHKLYFVTAEENFRVCSLCWENIHYKPLPLLVYPAAVSERLRINGEFRSEIPVHLPSCPVVQDLDELKIVYPSANARIWIPRDWDGEYQRITLKAAHNQLQSTIYWYLDQRFLGKTEEKHSISAPLKPGWHELRIVDQNGTQATRRFHSGRTHLN